MIKIKVIDKSKHKIRISPKLMLKNIYAGCIFQQYSHDFPQNNFYINCGLNEKSVIHIWYDDENEQYRLSTDNKKSLEELLPHVSVLEIDAEINLDLKF